MVYFKGSAVYIGEILFFEMEPNNLHSWFVVVVKNVEDKMFVMSLLNFLISIREWNNWSGVCQE